MQTQRMEPFVNLFLFANRASLILKTRRGYNESRKGMFPSIWTGKQQGVGLSESLTWDNGVLILTAILSS